jgi:23S rRNA (adenine1618-N6)-methyltransferase
MAKIKKKRPKEKSELHPRNLHVGRYNFKLLTESCPALAPFVRVNEYNDESIDFANPEAVKMLNTALLKHFYGVDNWAIPEGYLCPPIPGRADYIHYVADLLAKSNEGKVPTGNKIKCLDIGVGANCVYPIIGNKLYGWSFVGTDIDPVSIASANLILESNPLLKEQVECRLQENPKLILNDVIRGRETFDVSVCNPPFHISMAAAHAGTIRKLSNLNHEKVTTPVLNFGGRNGELWCAGGEERFVADLIRESKEFATSCFWFTTLISKHSHLTNVYSGLEKAGATQVVTIPMGQGNKTSRIVAWSYLTKEQQEVWRAARWK